VVGRLKVTGGRWPVLAERAVDVADALARWPGPGSGIGRLSVAECLRGTAALDGRPVVEVLGTLPEYVEFTAFGLTHEDPESVVIEVAGWLGEDSFVEYAPYLLAVFLRGLESGGQGDLWLLDEQEALGAESGPIVVRARDGEAVVEKADDTDSAAFRTRADWRALRDRVRAESLDEDDEPSWDENDDDVHAR